MSSTSMLGCGHGGVQYEQRVDVSTVRCLSSMSGIEGNSMVNMIRCGGMGIDHDSVATVSVAK